MSQFNEAQFNSGSSSATTGTRLVRGLIYRAMRIAGITGAPGRTPSADQFADALEALNGMLRTWRLSATFDTIDDPFTLPELFDEAIVYNLADRLCSMFHDPAGRRLMLAPEDLFRARQSLSELLADHSPTPLTTPDCAVFPQGPRYGAYDIFTDGYLR